MHVLRSGSTVIQHVYDTHFAGIAEVERVAAAWEGADGLLPADVVARVPDAQGRRIC